MNTPTQHPLCLALATAGILTTASADAVQVSADGRGQVLLYPYYTTRTDSAGNAYGTLLSVVNRTASAKAARVRFLEGKNGRDVLNFNLFLSPFDVWTAAVLPDMTTGGAKVGTLDLSCTLPPFSTSPAFPFVHFSNASYSGMSDDGAGTSLDRTKEGYFEIIEMATYTSSSATGKAVTHVNGVPPCSFAGLPPLPPIPIQDTQAAVDAQPPGGGLFGAMTFITVASGTEYSADAVALANFYEAGANYHPVGTALPDLTQAAPPISSVHAPDGRLFESTWSPDTADPVSAVLMRESVMNEYLLDSATKSSTDWVVTMPTKRYYVNTGTSLAPKLFQRNFNGPVGSCDDVSLNIYDREERIARPPSIMFPGQPPVLPKPLCWGANVLPFGPPNPFVSTVFGSTNTASVDLVFQNGWLTLGFPVNIPAPAALPNVHKLINTGATTISGRGEMTTGNTVTYVGLPVIGFAAISFTNGTLVVGGQAVLSNYGGSFVHKTSTLIQ